MLDGIMIDGQLIKKGIEIRTWKPPKNLKLPANIYLHAAKGVDKKSLKMFNMKVDEKELGAILGVGTLVGYKQYTNKVEWEADEQKHLNPLEWYDGKQIGLLFEGVQRLQTIIPCKGQLGMFKVNIDVGDTSVFQSKEFIDICTEKIYAALRDSNAI